MSQGLQMVAIIPRTVANAAVCALLKQPPMPLIVMKDKDGRTYIAK